MVTDCKQEVECELDLSQLSFNAILHSYCCEIVLIFCRGEEELCHFLVFIFTGIQMHSYYVQLQWHVCHAILTSGRRTAILERRIYSQCALDSEQRQHAPLGSAGLERVWPDTRVGSTGEAPCASLWWGRPSGCPFSYLLSPTSVPCVILHHEEEMGQLEDLRCPFCLPCECSKIYQPWKMC